MKTFEELFRAARSGPLVDSLLAKGADGIYWNATVQQHFDWFNTGRAQNLALLKAMHDLLESVPAMSNIAGFGKLMCDVEEVLNNEKA